MVAPYPESSCMLNQENYNGELCPTARPYTYLSPCFVWHWQTAGDIPSAKVFPSSRVLFWVLSQCCSCSLSRPGGQDAHVWSVEWDAPSGVVTACTGASSGLISPARVLSNPGIWLGGNRSVAADHQFWWSWDTCIISCSVVHLEACSSGSNWRIFYWHLSWLAGTETRVV